MTVPPHDEASAQVPTISIVMPVYLGVDTVPVLVEQIAGLRDITTPAGRKARIAELILVWDNGPDASDEVLRRLGAENDWIRPIWLSRNFGQHAATVAGMASSGSDWIVTIDEDGQHDPSLIGEFIDAAYDDHAHIVYARPTNPPPHGFLRNTASKLAKGVISRALTGGAMTEFHSFRLVAGDVGRAMAAYAGPGVYLDVALSWITTRITWADVPMRAEGRDTSTYNFRRLSSHLWRLVLSSGNRPLRLMSGLGVVSALAGALYAVWLVVARIQGMTDVQGWTTVVVCVLVLGGLILLSLGVIAEYVGLAASMSMGRPGFVVLDDPARRFGTKSVDT